jgi:hypothetical protein
LPEYARRTSTPATASATSDEDHRFRPPSELLGTWVGTVQTYEGTVPVRLAFDSDGSVRFARTDSVPDDPGVPPIESLAVEYRDGTFRAHFPVALPLTAAERHEHWTWLTVTQAGDTLRGFATAHAADAPLFGLPSYVELRRR